MIFCNLRIFVALISVLSLILNNDSYQSSIMNIYLIEKFFQFVANAFGDFYTLYSKKYNSSLFENIDFFCFVFI